MTKVDHIVIIQIIFLIICLIQNITAFEIEIGIDSDKYNTKNVDIFLKNANDNTSLTTSIIEGKVIFNESLLSKNISRTSTINAIVCFNGKNPCSGYLFSFPLDKRLGNKLIVTLSDKVKGYNLTKKDYPGIECSDKNLIYCAASTWSPIEGIITLLQEEKFNEENGIKKCEFPDVKGIDGLYFLTTVCSDGFRTMVDSRPFFQRTIEVENPYKNNSALASINLSKTNCVFEEGIDYKEFNLSPGEKLTIDNLNCATIDKIPPEINIIKIEKFEININLAIFGGISITVLSFGIYYFKCKNKK